MKNAARIALVDLPCFGRAAGWCGASIGWRARTGVPDQSWTVEDRRIAAPRLALTDRAGRWVTMQVGRCGRTVNEVADELGCDWHTINDAVVAYGDGAVDDDPDRIGERRPRAR